MDRDVFFTQCKKTMYNRRKQVFLLVGMMPLLLFFAFWTWIGSMGRIRYGFGPENIVFVMPAVLAVQMVLLAVRLHGLRLMHLKLSTDAIELHGTDEVRRFLLRDLRRIRIVRDHEGGVRKIILRFEACSVRISGYLEMGILRDMLIRYASTGLERQPVVTDPVRIS